MRKHLNKFLYRTVGLLLTGITIFAGPMNVQAITLTVEIVSDEFNKTPLIESLETLGTKYSSFVNKYTKTLDIIESDKKVFSFKYTEDYIEFDNRSTVVTEENAFETVGAMLFIENLIEAVIKASGYNAVTLKENADLTNYDRYGILLETEKFDFSGQDENGGSWSSSGDYLKYFKISLNTTRIDALIAAYGTDITKTVEEIFNSLTPSISINNVTDTSMTIHTWVEDIDSTIGQVYCNLYRSTSENGEYVLVNVRPLDCANREGVIDEGLTPNTTYFYKSLVIGSKTYSNPLDIKTKVNNDIEHSLTSSTNDTVENPRTDRSLNAIFACITILLSITGISILNKKRIFKNL